MKMVSKKVGVVTLILIFLLTPLVNVLAENIDKDSRYYAPMSETVTVKTGEALPLEPDFPEGEDLENNDVIKWVSENLNIEYEVDWTSSDQNQAYENRINVLIASNNLPNYLTIPVEPQGLSILRKLVDNDMIMDLTDFWESHASPTLKEYHKKSDNKAFRDVTFDEKIMAIPNLSDIETAIPVVWVRQDWLDELGLEGPETVEDVAEITRAFMEEDPDGNGKDDTAALPATSALYKGDTATFDWVFGANNAYPGDWIEKDGEIVYGSIQPETRAALLELQEMYKNGLIDKEFPIKDSAKAVEPVMSNKAGVFQGAWWSTWWPIQSSVKNDKNAEWKAYFIKSDDGNSYARSYPVVRHITVVRKDYEHPEAIMKLANWYQLASLKKLDWYNDLEGKDGKYANTDAALWPVDHVGAKYIDEISRRYNKIMKVMNGDVNYENAENETKFQVDQIKSYKEQDKATDDMALWSSANQWLKGASVFTRNDIKQKIPAFAGTTKLMSRKESILRDLEMQTFLNIITGRRSIEKFDEFVETWKRLGGKDITEEINQIVD